jgi:hypothetical protein
MGVPASLLPSGTSGSSLAAYLTQHLRTLRGFSLTRAGYHTNGPGFWLSLAYYPCGLFLINGERSRQLGSDLDLLLLAFKHNVLGPPDPRMVDPKQYAIETVYVHFGASPPTIAGKRALLASPCCRTQPQIGWHRVTLAEFLPLAATATNAQPAPNQTATTSTIQAPFRVTLPGPAAPTAKTATSGSSRPLKPGEICPRCGAEVRKRDLLNSTYVGCLC